jgi:hypothetical protein
MRLAIDYEKCRRAGQCSCPRPEAKGTKVIPISCGRAVVRLSSALGRHHPGRKQEFSGRESSKRTLRKLIGAADEE